MQGISQFQEKRPIVVPQERNPWSLVLPNLVSGIVGQVLQNKLTEGVKEQAINEKLALAGWREIPSAPAEDKESGPMGKVMGFLGGGKQDVGTTPPVEGATKFGNKWYLPPAVTVDPDTGIVTEGPNIKMRIPVDKTIPLTGMKDASGKQVYGTTADLINVVKMTAEKNEKQSWENALANGDITPEQYAGWKKIKADAEKGTPETPAETPSSGIPGVFYYKDQKGVTHVVKPDQGKPPVGKEIFIKAEPGESTTGVVSVNTETGKRTPNAIPLGPAGVAVTLGDMFGPEGSSTTKTPLGQGVSQPTKNPMPAPPTSVVPVGTDVNGRKVFRSNTRNKNGGYDYYTDE
jgi:hypothetical protein